MKFTCLLGSRISVFFSALHSAILQNPKSVSGAILNFTITERFFARCLVESYVWYENRGMEMTWWWPNLVFSFSQPQFSEKLLRKLTSNLSMLSCKIQIDNNFSWAALLSTKEMTSTFSKLYSKTTRLRSVLPLQSFEHIDVISMVDKNTDHEILLSIRYDQYLPGSLLELFKISHEYHRE